MKLWGWLAFGFIFGNVITNRHFSVEDIDRYGELTLHAFGSLLGMGVGVIGFLLERLYEWGFKKDKSSERLKP